MTVGEGIGLKTSLGLASAALATMFATGVVLAAQTKHGSGDLCNVEGQVEDQVVLAAPVTVVEHARARWCVLPGADAPVARK